MTIDDLIEQLQAARAAHGNIEVHGYWDDCSWGIGGVRLATPSEIWRGDEPYRPVLLIDVSIEGANLMFKPVEYAVKVKSDDAEQVLVATFRPVDVDIVNQHPIDQFGDVFRETIQRAALAFDDPNVREVPIYREGVLEPVAYLRRAP